MSEKEMYCGAGSVPKNKIRGTPEYCVQTNQIRYYGRVAIDEKLLNQSKIKTSNLIKEQLKLKKIGDDAKILIKEVKTIKIILEDNKATNSQKKKAEKKMNELLLRRDRLVKRLKTQGEVVSRIEAEEKRLAKKAKADSKKVKKSSSKTAKKSSSKTAKKSSSKKTKSKK